MVPVTFPLKDIPLRHQALFDLLLDANKHSSFHAILRVAGGWVRDTLLGTGSHDIDITIETTTNSPHLITGELFAHAVADFQQASGIPSHSISVVRSNPAMSKHIETAIMKLKDFDVEFCSLRTETYDANSRIPAVFPGNPFEDATRRDFTINALFYNLHTKSVEDYLTGIDDLEHHLIRCPLPPQQTFFDDPLRLLRAIRFAARLNFDLDPSIREAVSPTLIDALKKKVSSERIGIEWTKIITNPNPEVGIGYMAEMNLLEEVIMQEIIISPNENQKITTKKKFHQEKKDSSHSAGSESFVTRPVTPNHQPVIQLNHPHLEFTRQLLNKIVSIILPLTNNADTIFYETNSTPKLINAMFLLAVAPFHTQEWREMSTDERLKRIYNWSQLNLKLPAIITNGVRRMLDAMSILTVYFATVSQNSKNEPHSNTTEENSKNEDITAVWYSVTPEFKDAMFDALQIMHDKSLEHLSAVPLVLLVSLCLSTSCFIRRTSSNLPGREFSSWLLPEDFKKACFPSWMLPTLEKFWKKITIEHKLHEVISKPPLLKGSDLQEKLGINPRETAKILLKLRRFSMHHPEWTIQTLLEHLKEDISREQHSLDV